MNIEHYKLGQIAALDRHNRRLNSNYSNENINPAKTGENVTLIPVRRSLYRDAAEQVQERVLSHGGRVTKNSVYITELCFTLPKGIEKEQADDYFRAILDFFRRAHDERNLLSAVIHKDETSYHMHLDFCDITRSGKLCRKELWTKDTLTKLHDTLPAYLQKCGFEVERGDKLTSKKARQMAGRSIDQYKADMLKKDIEALQQERDELLDGNTELAYDIIDELEEHEYEISR